MSRFSRLVALILMVACCSLQARDYRVETVANYLRFPWSLAFLPDGRMLITERTGRLLLVENGVLNPDPVSGLPAMLVAGQAGLFEVSVDPEFVDNHFIFLSLAHGTTHRNHLRVVRAKLEGNALQDVTTIFDVSPAKRGDVHFGGRIAWLPDHTLVIGTGDGFIYRELAQKMDTHLGKIVRITRDGSAPADNPFLGRANVLPEIYALGNRNVQGMVFDTETNTLFEHEHGPRGGDEINVIRSGRNYGWPLITYGLDYTGALISPYTERAGLEQPIVQWTPSIAPAGMTMYRGKLFPQWYGSLFVAALAGQKVQRVPIVDGKAGVQESLFGELGVRFRDVRSGPDGALWLLTDASAGRLLRVVPAK